MLFASLLGLMTKLLGTFVTVDVEVRDPSGVPVPGLVVRLSTLDRNVDLNSDYRNYLARTDRDGRVSFHYWAVSTFFSCSVDSPREDFPDEAYEPQLLDFQRFKATSHGLWSTFHERRKTVKFVVKRKPVPEKIIVSETMAGKAVGVDKGTLGFDLVKNDWVKPHGHGKTADFWIDYARKSRGDRNEIACRMYFKGKDEGFYVVPRELLDRPESCRVDMAAQFQNEGFAYYNSMGGGRSVMTNLASRGECLVLRTRVAHDELGKMSSAHYSVIRGTFHIWRAISMGGYMFNTRPNDTNLEFKGPIWR